MAFNTAMTVYKEEKKVIYKMQSSVQEWKGMTLVQVLLTNKLITETSKEKGQWQIEHNHETDNLFNEI